MLMSQPVLGQLAVGVPRVEVSNDVAFPLKAAGTLVRLYHQADVIVSCIEIDKRRFFRPTHVKEPNSV